MKQSNQKTLRRIPLKGFDGIGFFGIEAKKSRKDGKALVSIQEMEISSMIKDVEEHLHFCNVMMSCSLLPYLIQFKYLEPMNPVLKCMEKTR